jgi:hypothetical protein
VQQIGRGPLTLSYESGYSYFFISFLLPIVIHRFII